MRPVCHFGKPGIGRNWPEFPCYSLVYTLYLVVESERE